MFKYLINPSPAPKRKRRNPELLIVNPYSLDDGREKQKMMRAKMSKKNRRYRRNPSLAEIKSRFLGENLANVKQAAIMAAAGGFSLVIGSAVVGARFGESSVAKGLVAILSGVAGGVAAQVLGEKLNINFIRDAAVPGAMGAMVLGLWSIIQAPVENAAATVLATAGVAPTGTAGWGSWTKEFDTPALSGLGQSYYDEFTRGVSPGMNGLGQPVVAASDLSNPGSNPFLHGYEPLGDIMNNQRLGSFEAEPGFGSFVAENANPRDQQVADVMKNASGAYGGYEGAFDPFIES